MTRGLAAAVLVAVLAGATGCGYHLAGHASAASFLPEDVRTIGVPLLENRTDQADIHQRITEALIDEIVRRARVEARATRRDVDAILEGRITSYRETPVTFTEGGRFSRVEVTITAEMRLVRASPETVLWSQSHFVFREQYDVPETPSERFDRELVAIDEIARGFARTVVTSLLEGF
ncbi:MAG: hypothetical protein Kow0062_08490 [Acidobacteriota bacterium]|nr:MAG: hypothetical protein D6738_00045 [Acidobacteriota bacterium]